VEGALIIEEGLINPLNLFGKQVTPIISLHLLSMILDHHVKFAGKYRHMALDCFHYMNYINQGRHPPAKLAVMDVGSHNSQANDPWMTDSRVKDHLIVNLGNLSMQTTCKGAKHITIGNGQALPFNNIGNVILRTKTFNFRFQNILHVPKIASVLLSMHRLCKDINCRCHFDADHFCIHNLHSGRFFTMA